MQWADTCSMEQNSGLSGYYNCDLTSIPLRFDYDLTTMMTIPLLFDFNSTRQSGHHDSMLMKA